MRGARWMVPLTFDLALFLGAEFVGKLSRPGQAHRRVRAYEKVT